MKCLLNNWRKQRLAKAISSGYSSFDCKMEPIATSIRKPLCNFNIAAHTQLELEKF